MKLSCDSLQYLNKYDLTVSWYNIPSYDVAVELRQMKVKGYTSEGKEKHYDIFIRNLHSFMCVYPVWMAVRDVTIVGLNLLFIIW